MELMGIASYVFSNAPLALELTLIVSLAWGIESKHRTAFVRMEPLMMESV
jgi:hypothetical protein